MIYRLVHHPAMAAKHIDCSRFFRPVRYVLLQSFVSCFSVLSILLFARRASGAGAASGCMKPGGQGRAPAGLGHKTRGKKKKAFCDKSLAVKKKLRTFAPTESTTLLA